MRVERITKGINLIFKFSSLIGKVHISRNVFTAVKQL